MSRISANIREQVKQRAIGGRCEYCKLPESLSKFSHQVDHIIPPRHGGNNDLSNLAWACFNCNNSKGTDIATYEQDVLTSLFNPRNQIWDDNFRTEESGYVIGLTIQGKATLRLLQMNKFRLVQMRRILIEIGLW